MKNYVIHSNVDIGDGEIPWLHVVAPAGRGISKPNTFARLSVDAKSYILSEYNEMRHMAEALLQKGTIDKDTPILYPEKGGAVAAQAIADVTGGTIYPMEKGAPGQFVLSEDTKKVLEKAPRIIVADDVIYTGNAIRKTKEALKDVYHGETMFMANRMVNKFLKPELAGEDGKAGGIIGMFLPERAQIFTGGIYIGKDNAKTSYMMESAERDGLTLGTLASAASSVGSGGPGWF